MSPLTQLYLAGGYVLVGLVATIFGAASLDKLGRVNVMVWGILAQVAVLCIECALSATYSGTSNRSGNIAGIWAFFFYESIYACTWDCAPYVYVSEIMPSHLRAKGVTLSIAALYVSVCALAT
jgi:MFS family permease